MPSSNEYFVAESDGQLGVLRINPYHGVALSEISYAHAVLDAIQAFESESKSVLLVCVPRGNLAPDRMETFWEAARHGAPIERNLSAPFCRSTTLPLPMLRLETGVVQLLKLLQKVKLFKIIAVEGDIDFDMLGFLLAFDVRYCGRATVFENRTLDRGTPPGFGVLWYLARHLGQPATLDLVLNQRSIDAEEALHLKLVTHLADDAMLTDAALQYAKEIARKPSAVLNGLAKVTSFLSCDFETYLDQFGGGYTRLPPIA